MHKTIAVVISILLFTSLNAKGHSEHDKSRFVAQNGIDNSRCDNVLRPCKSIAYAVKQANKGDKILVASGHFPINSSEELFYLKSALVPVRGGYNRFDHFQSQSPQSNITTLSNVPEDMVEDLRKNGFRIIADGKAFAKDEALKQKLANYYELSNSQANEACIDGKAGIFECSNIDLLAHMPLSQMSSKPNAGNDIWGHVDLNNGNEYALMGIYNGVIVVDVTTPSSPQEVGTISGVNSAWRDIKVYQYFDENINQWQAYAYATTEGSNNGATDYVTIIDLNNLPNSVSLIEKNKIVTTAHNVTISNVDYALNITLPKQTASLQLVGANSRSGAFQNFSLSDPKTLTSVNTKNYGSGYTHDGAFITVEDQRSASDCGISEGSCVIYIDFNEKEMKLWNITDPNDSKVLGLAEYNDVSKSNQYVHSGWSTENKQFVLLHDEFDEYKGGLNTTVRIFSISDLKNPIQVGQWTGPTRAIDHNGFVRGNRYYMSNYERGLTVLDITDPTSPSEVGFFDTYTPSNSASFNGAWGVYPFLPSGNILISDINSGLYILQDNAKSSTKGQFTFTQKQVNTAQGTTLTLSVQRNGTDFSETATVSYQVIQGSAKTTQDFQLDDNTLTWAANNNSEKEITITIAADATGNEYPENFFIRLYNPTNGATLGQHSYTTINIEGVEDNGTASFAQAQLTLAENSGSTNIAVSRIGSTTGETSFTYALTSTSATIGTDVNDTSGTITWLDGESNSKNITISIIDDNNEEENEQFQLTLTSVNNSRLGANATVTITIADDDNNQAPVITLPESFEANTAQTVSLTAQANDADGDTMQYSWQQLSGETVTLTDTNQLATSFVAPTTAQPLVFRFSVTDFRGATATEEITVTIIEPLTPTPAPVTPTKSSGGGGSTSIISLLLLIGIFIRKRFY